MKIAYCAHSKIPSKAANSIHVMKICHALANQGHDVRLIVPNTQEEDGNPYDFYGVNSNFKIEHVVWPKIKLGVLIYSYRAIKKVKEEPGSVVYGRDLTTCFFSALSGIPTIWESHTPVDYMGGLYVRFFKIMCRKKSFRKLVVITSTLKKFYEEKYKIPSEIIEVLPDCSDVVDLSKKKPAVINNKDCDASVGYIGQLYPGKGMEIISQLIPHCPNIMFHIIGGYKEDVEKWKKNLTSYKNVTFYGFMKPSETVEYGLSMDILIAPYLRKVGSAGAKKMKTDLSKWMSPLKLFEYMSYKKPIVSSDLPVLHDVLNSNNSIMCNPDDILEWSTAINVLINNKEFAKKIAEQAYMDFTSNYTWDKRAEKIANLY